MTEQEPAHANQAGEPGQSIKQISRYGNPLFEIEASTISQVNEALARCIGPKADFGAPLYRTGCPESV